jgi:putative oxidoreductase
MMLNFLDLFGRILISIIFLYSGINKILNFEGTSQWMESFGVPGILLAPAIAVEIIFPIFLILGFKTRLAAAILSLFCIITALIFHNEFSNQMQLIAFLKNIGLTGGLLLIIVHGTKEWAFENKKKYVRL